MKSPDYLSLRLLRCFVTVAEELHFHRAAERLNMRQPPLTQRIKGMEQDLGVELFRRIGNRVELTDAGRVVLKSAKDTLAQAEGFCEVAERAARGECGRIRVALTTTALFFDSVQQAMRNFQHEHPDVSLELTHVSSGPAMTGLRQRSLDVCLIRPFLSPLPPDWEETVIERDRLMLVLPAGHPQTRAKRIPLSAVADERFISLARKRGIALYAQTMHLWEKSGLKPRVAQEAHNGPAVMGLVAAGLGYSILPSSLQTIRFERVTWRAIEIDDRWTESSLNLVYHKDILAEKVPARFIACLRQRSSEVNIVRQFG